MDFATVTSTNNTMEVLLNAPPRAPCRKSAVSSSMTVCQPQDATFSNAPLHIVAQGNSANHVADNNLFIDNVLRDPFPAASIGKFFGLSPGRHLLTVKCFDPPGPSFLPDRPVTIFSSPLRHT